MFNKISKLTGVYVFMAGIAIASDIPKDNFERNELSCVLKENVRLSVENELLKSQQISTGRKLFNYSVTFLAGMFGAYYKLDVIGDRYMYVTVPWTKFHLPLKGKVAILGIGFTLYNIHRTKPYYLQRDE